MKITQLPLKTRIHYTGDMANQGGFGSIVGHEVSKWGQFVDIKMDDGRLMNQIPVCIFSDEFLGHGGTRFVTIQAYNAYRQAIANHNGFTYKPAV